MKLVALGTSGGAPTKRRNCTAFVLKLESFCILFDCSEGTQRRLLEADIKISKIKYIFISHLHLDHIAGLTPLMSTKSMFNIPGEITLIGPKGIKEYIRLNLATCGSELNYKYTFHELTDDFTHTFKEFTLNTKSLNHRIASYGFRLKFNNKPGTIDLDKVKQLGLEIGPDLGKLQKGEIVSNENGKEIKIDDISNAPKIGKIFTYVGDTYLCDSIAELCKNADVALLESTFQKKDFQRAQERFHLTSFMDGEIARDNNIKNLILYHFSAAYPGLLGFIEDAKESFSGSVYAMHDLDEIEFNGIYKQTDILITKK